MDYRKCRLNEGYRTFSWKVNSKPRCAHGQKKDFHSGGIKTLKGIFDREFRLIEGRILN
jgi:hypothetical protein